MAKKGTFAAYRGAQPDLTDFGGIAQGVADRYVAEQDKKVANKAKSLALKQKQAEYAGKLRKEHADNLFKLREYHDGSTPILVGAGNLSAKIFARRKDEYAKTKLIAADRNQPLETQAQALEKLSNMQQNGEDFATAVNSINTAFNTISKNPEKFDPDLSAPEMIKMFEAFRNNKVSKSFVDSETGDVVVSDGITLKDLKNGKYEVSFTDENGKSFIKAPLGDLQGLIESKMTPLVDLESTKNEWQSDYVGTTVEEYEVNGATTETTIKTDINKARKYLNTQFDQGVGLEDSRGNPTREAKKWLLSHDGADVNDMKKEWVDAKVGKIDKQLREKVSKTPGATISKSLPNIIKEVGSMLAGNEDAIGALLQKQTITPTGITIDKPKDYSYTRTDGMITISASNNKGQKQSVSYDLSDKSDYATLVKNLGLNATNYKGIRGVNQTEVLAGINEMDIKPNTDSRYYLPFGKYGTKVVTEAAEEIAGKKKMKFADLENIVAPIIATLKKKGLTVEMKGTPLFGNNTIKITDADGTVVASGDNYRDVTSFEEFPKVLEKGFHYVEKRDNPERFANSTPTPETPVEKVTTEAEENLAIKTPVTKVADSTKTIKAQAEAIPVGTMVKVGDEDMTIEDAVELYSNNSAFKGVSKDVIRASLAAVNIDNSKKKDKKVDKKKDLGFRNNNPGNLRPTGKSKGFRKFDSLSLGFDAMVKDISIKMAGKSVVGVVSTLGELISKYAPDSENDTEAYIKSVSEHLGVESDELLDNLKAEDVAEAMIKVESPDSYKELFGS